MGVCNLKDGIGGALEESCLSSSNFFSFLQNVFYVLLTKNASKGPLIALFLMTLHLLEFLQGLSLGAGTEYCVRIFISLSRGRSVWNNAHGPKTFVSWLLQKGR